MILITGGAYQGKLEFAKSLVSDRGGEEPDILYHMERYIGRLVDDGEDVEEKLHEMMREHPNPIIICDEVSSGVIPIDEKEVTYREAVGRTVCYLAKMADEVYRVYCGIGERIK